MVAESVNTRSAKMKVYELIKELKKYNLNNNVFVNVLDDSKGQDDIYPIEDININCDADYNDTFILITKH